MGEGVGLERRESGASASDIRNPKLFSDIPSIGIGPLAGDLTQAGGHDEWVDVEDRRQGPLTEPANKLSPAEREVVLKTANSPEYRDLSPKQIVPRLADEGTYMASESTFYRLLRAANQMAHRQRAKPATSKRPREQVATGPNQV